MIKWQATSLLIVRRMSNMFSDSFGDLYKVGAILDDF